MPISIRCRTCPVISVGFTVPSALVEFDAHEKEFHSHETAPGGAVGSTETTASVLDTRTWETRVDALDGQGERDE